MKAYRQFSLVLACLVFSSISMAATVPLYLNPDSSSSAFSAWTGVRSNVTYDATNAYSTYFKDQGFQTIISGEARVKYEITPDGLSLLTEYFETGTYPACGGGGSVNTLLEIGTTSAAPAGTPVDLTISMAWDGPDAMLGLEREGLPFFDGYGSSGRFQEVTLLAYAGERLNLHFYTQFFPEDTSGEISFRATVVPEPLSLMLLGFGSCLFRASTLTKSR